VTTGADGGRAPAAARRPDVPIVDLGCGSGRQARALAALAPRVLALDGSAAAIGHARRAASDAPVEYRVEDITRPGLGARLAAAYPLTAPAVRPPTM
jgi:methylase of polypeptide subunit release factors